MSQIDVALWETKQSLEQIGFDVSHGKYPARMLKDLKSTVDQLRLTLWAITEFDSRREDVTKTNPAQLRKKLIKYRVRRLEQMLGDLRTDLTKCAAAAKDREMKRLATALRSTLRSISGQGNGQD